MPHSTQEYTEKHGGELPSHRRGRWFESSIAHQTNQGVDGIRRAKDTGDIRSIGPVPVRFQGVTQHRDSAVIILYAPNRVRLFLGNGALQDKDRLQAELTGPLLGYVTSPIANEATGRLLYACWRAARSRSLNRGTECTITYREMLAIYNEQEGCCAVTGIPFDLCETRAKSGHDRRPLRPSIDRIDCRQGYVRGNVRLVAAAVNYAMGPWGEGIFRLLAAFCRRTTKTNLGQGEG